MHSLPAPGGECPAIVSVWGEERRDYNGADTLSQEMAPKSLEEKDTINKTVVVYTKTHGKPPALGLTQFLLIFYFCQ